MKKIIFLLTFILTQTSLAGIFQGTAKNDDKILVGSNNVKSIKLTCYSGGEEVLSEDVVAVYSRPAGNKGFGDHRILAWKNFNGTRNNSVESSKPHYILNERTPCKTTITYQN